MDKIYHYTRIENAISIIKDKAILLSNPQKMNDIYDCNFFQDETDKKKCYELYENYAGFVILSQSREVEKLKMNKITHLYMMTLIKELNAMRIMMNKNPFFYPTPAFEATIKRLYRVRPDLKLRIKKELENVELKNAKMIEDAKSSALIGSFATKNDSILMWSHYSASHRGVCLEFEKPLSDEFQNVEYGPKRPSIKLYKAISHILALKILGKETENITNQLVIKELARPFYKKSPEWDYESEVRCIFSVKNPTEKISINEKGYMYEIGYPKAIYIGAKAMGKELDHLIKIAKDLKIPYYFMKESRDSYQIIVDESKKYLIKEEYKNTEITLERLINDIDKSLEAQAYLSAFATSLIIPAICSEIEINYIEDSKEKYIKWCNENLPCCEKDDNGRVLVSGELCWKIKEKLYSHGNIDIEDDDIRYDSKKLILDVEKKGIYNFSIGQASDDFNYLNVVTFCTNMIMIARLSLEKHKDEILNMPQIRIRDLERKKEDMWLYSERRNMNIE